MPLPFARALPPAALLCLVSTPPFATEPGASPTTADVIQMLADVALIDGTCPGVAVDFGRAFQVATETGLRASEVMPAGPQRAAFEAASRLREARTPHDVLCQDVVRAYAVTVPGLLRAR